MVPSSYKNIREQLNTLKAKNRISVEDNLV